jgi:hypothetical protein|tara:strand:+ start:75 stop:530 length:456 start_codon:yes stop_codon:yes gene_type:complete
MPKQIYNWGKVTAGDIISFRYKGKKQSARLTTILVLNPRLPVIGKNTFHLVGLKLESQGVRPVVRDKEILAKLLGRIGIIEVVSGDDEIFRVDIVGANNLGAKRDIYIKSKRQIDKYNLYRTYDYKEARKSSVFLEPIALPKALVEVLVGN